MNILQFVSEVVNNFRIFIVVVGILFLLVSLTDTVELKSFKMKIADTFNLMRGLGIGIGCIFIIMGVLFGNILFPQSAYGTSTPVAPTHTASAPTPQPTAFTPQDDFQSSLLPQGQPPTIDDPLKDNSQEYAWDEGDGCSFAQGRYLLSASAGLNNGIGCNPGNSRGIFGNFVYQVEMTILTGLHTDQSGAGPTFRVNTSGNGQQYQVDFDVAGNWDVESDTTTLTSNSASCASPCPYFHSGFNQPNVITISASGNLMQIQINGYPLGSYTDNTYTSGYIGMQMSPGTEDSSVAFSNLRVWKL